MKKFIKLWNSMPNVFRLVISLIVYTWIIFWFGAVVIDSHSWAMIPYICTCIAGYLGIVRVDKW